MREVIVLPAFKNRESATKQTFNQKKKKEDIFMLKDILKDGLVDLEIHEITEQSEAVEELGSSCGIALVCGGGNTEGPKPFEK